MDSFDDRIKYAISLLKASEFVMAFTGAGISTESGISDFRSKGGVWDRYRIVTFQEFNASSKARAEYWQMKKELFNEIKDAQPNDSHIALVALEKAGKLKCLVTQNIDGLHQDAGSTNVIELHGTNRQAICLDCGKQWPIEDIQQRLEAGELAPACYECNGHIKPATISFGQTMPEEKMTNAYNCALRCDLLIMAGSSLQVEPAASIPREAHRTGSKLIYINRTPTPTDYLAEVLFNENAGEVMSALIQGLNAQTV
jgi:NAD-dependent deacetylase